MINFNKENNNNIEKYFFMKKEDYISFFKQIIFNNIPQNNLSGIFEFTFDDKNSIFIPPITILNTKSFDKNIDNDYTEISKDDFFINLNFKLNEYLNYINNFNTECYVHEFSSYSLKIQNNTFLLLI